MFQRSPSTVTDSKKPYVLHHPAQAKNLNFHPSLEVIKLELILRLKIKRNDWLLADMCPQAANHCAFKV